MYSHDDQDYNIMTLMEYDSPNMDDKQFHDGTRGTPILGHRHTMTL